MVDSIEMGVDSRDIGESAAGVIEQAQGRNEGKPKSERMVFFRNVVVLAIFAALTLAYVNRSGAYPWGSDTYGHLYKANILYDHMRTGGFFLNYNEGWYNGIQPFRYWAPLPYYILAAINMFSGNIITTYNIFIAFVFIIGGLGWLCWGYYIKRQNLCLIFALLWFFVPNNLRILFSEGNIPYVVVNSLLPFVFLYFYRTIHGAGTGSPLLLAFFMGLLTLTHAMLAAMMGLSLFLLAAFDALINKRYLRHVVSLGYAFLGVLAASFWLYPALKGGILSMSKSAVASVMRNLTYPLGDSLNPVLRFSNIEIFYFGAAFALTAVFGFLFSTRNERAPFLSALLILLGTTKVALPLLEELPMNQLFWMSRFTSIAMAMVVMGILMWKRLRKSVLAFLTILLFIDSIASFYVLGHNGQYPAGLSKTLDQAAGIAVQRVGLLDNSSFGSFPSYRIGYHEAPGVTSQVYGWAWQGATTSKNIVTLNTALEGGYYGFMFDRSLELGADTLVVKKSLVVDFRLLQAAASGVGYEKVMEDDQVILYKYPVTESFGTSVRYEGIGIGSYASNIAYMFPKFRTAEDIYLDSYSYDDLKDRKAIFLSGFKYRNKEKAEDLVLALSRDGIRVVVDATGLEESFLGVTAEPVTIEGGYRDILYRNQKLQMQAFPEAYRSWRTSFLHGVDSKESYEIVNSRKINYIGSKENGNLTFIGLNIPYYAFLTKDENALTILGDALGLKAYELPSRGLHTIQAKREGSTLNINSDSTDIIVPIAASDAFEVRKGSYSSLNNLIYLETPELVIRIGYPYLTTGIALSLVSVLLLTGLSVFLKRRFLGAGGAIPAERQKTREVVS